MDSLTKYSKLEEFVRLFFIHKNEIEEQMPRAHSVNKYKNHNKYGLIISTAELCLILINSKNELAKRFCFTFGMESATEKEFDKFLNRLKKHGFIKELEEIKRRKSLPYIDVQHSTNLLRGNSNRDISITYNYSDYEYFIDYQFLSGNARGYEVHWNLLNKAVEQINGKAISKNILNTTNKTTKLTINTSYSRIDKISELLNKTKEYDSSSELDAREKVERSIALRRGQNKFREALKEIYKRKCAITGTDVVSALEAAHIRPYKGEVWNHPTNGLLLRADIHTLFDLHLLSINEDNKERCHKFWAVS